MKTLLRLGSVVVVGVVGYAGWAYSQLPPAVTAKDRLEVACSQFDDLIKRETGRDPRVMPFQDVAERYSDLHVTVCGH